MTVNIGLPIPQSSTEALDIDRLRKYLVAADVGGIDSLWVTEQVFGPGPRLAALELLTFAAALTSRATLATGILQAGLRSPALLAKSLTTLDHLSGGRVLLGVAAGSDKDAYLACGLSSEKTGAQLADCVTLLKRMWTEDSVTDHGPRWQIDGGQLYPKPLQRPHPPIWFGGSSPVALKRAVRLGSGWLAPGASSTERYLKELEMVRSIAADAGHQPGEFKVGKRVYMAVDDTAGKAIDRLRDWFGRTYAGRDPKSVDNVAVWGTPETILEQLAPLLESRPDTVVLNPVFDELEQLDAITQSLAPAIRKSLA
jgi:alkanesulfonate monooxygenase SsuD/methylene tetrahydromethanopterin reductase-like flavin-dependent oxidoreductase (luciferase family)